MFDLPVQLSTLLKKNNKYYLRGFDYLILLEKRERRYQLDSENVKQYERQVLTFISIKVRTQFCPKCWSKKFNF